ncbi:MAG: hypothetical protein EBU46_18425 [Nitrosomonadaceae bacterium]|nr:hypothetical protein [Nitrosomonadaceae bacterium]
MTIAEKRALIVQAKKLIETAEKIEQLRDNLRAQMDNFQPFLLAVNGTGIDGCSALKDGLELLQHGVDELSEVV